MARYANNSKKLASLGVSALLGIATLSAPPVFGQTPLTLKQQQTNLEEVLRNSWNYWKANYVQSSGVVHSAQLNAATSEGQSYGMLLSVYNNDAALFERIWKFTRTNMRRTAGDPIFPATFKQYDNLFSWKWGPTPSGALGKLTTETATDGDEVIAYALFMGASLWGRSDYRQEGLATVQDLKKNSVRTILNRHYIAPGAGIYPNVMPYMSFNPSYVTPDMYLRFADEDSANRAFWQKLADDSYTTLANCSAQTSYALPPRWCGVYWSSGQMFNMRPPFTKESGFNPETARVYWHMGMASVKGSTKASTYLIQRPFLINRFQADKKLSANYAQDGSQIDPTWPTRLPYSALVTQTALMNPQNTWNIYQQTLGKQWNPQGFWEYGPDYFPTSIVWFNLYTAVQLLKKAQST